MSIEDVPAGGAGHTALHRTIEERIAALEAAPGGGGTRLIDLGTVTATDLLTGPVVLLDDPDVYVLGIYGLGDATPTDEAAYLCLFPLASGIPHAAEISAASPAGQISPTGWANQQLSGSYPLGTGRIVAVLLDNSSYPVRGPWAADTFYAAGDAIVGTTPAGYWSADNDGTSGATMPDFENDPVDGQLQDNEVLWVFSDRFPPTTGGGRFAALVAPLVTP